MTAHPAAQTLNATETEMTNPAPQRNGDLDMNSLGRNHSTADQVSSAKEIESLHVAFRRAAEILSHGNGPWKVTPNALRAMRAAVREFEAFDARLSQDTREESEICNGD